ncbi:urease accessory protein UreD [Sodalis sp. C49]|uniref:urease accessory protein UreD n=1 Tax=unclassified Sodalis (in: enterobacteria) TaxID=2636512 RepID=UPI003965D0A1
MTNDTVLPVPPPAGWLGKLALGFERRHGRTLLTTRRHSGPYRVQRAFYPQADHPHVYLLHPPGGVVGGDRLELSVAMAAQSHALLTMPGATKFYRSAGQLARVSQRFSLGEDSILEWLPQDNILFPAARVAIDTEFRLAPGARLLGFETLCLGRPAAGEAFTSGSLDASLRIILPGSPGLFERLRISAGRLEKLGGHPLSATFYATPVTEKMLAEVRLLLDAAHAPAAGASLLDSLLVVRVLDNDNQRLQHLLHRIWACLRPGMLGLEASPPRIWAT